VEVNKNIEYAAAKNLVIPKKIAVIVLVLKMLVISMISLKRFNEGGAAILHADNKNHQKVIAGNNTINPLDRNKLRELVKS